MGASTNIFNINLTTGVKHINKNLWTKLFEEGIQVTVDVLQLNFNKGKTQIHPKCLDKGIKTLLTF